MTKAVPRVSLRDIGKSYSARVLSGVDLDLAAGEVHALVGENGAGKSTLARILCGLTTPDHGHIALDGASYAPADRRAAEAAGVRMVHQELTVLPTLTVAENLFLDHLSEKANCLGWINHRRLHAEARAALARVGLEAVDPAQPAAALGLGQRQAVEIAAAFTRPCRLLILDEPTAALSEHEAQRLFQLVRELRAAGTSVIYISHRLNEIATICDRVSVLRDGVLVRTAKQTELDGDAIVKLMVGDRQRADVNRPPAPPADAPIALTVRKLRAGRLVKDVSFSVRRGEVLGLAGLVGAGRSETLRALYGADPREAGEVYLGPAGTPIDPRTPREAVAHGIGYVDEDRKDAGLLLPLAIRDNISLPRLRHFERRGRIDRARERLDALALVARLQVRCADVEQPVRELSGGNQQKVVIARVLATSPDVVMLDEPTRGVDVAARDDIWRLIHALAGRGKAVLVVSSDLPELLQICHRIAVMSLGRLVDTVDVPREPERHADLAERILAAAFSGHRLPATSPVNNHDKAMVP